MMRMHDNSQKAAGLVEVRAWPLVSQSQPAASSAVLCHWKSLCMCYFACKREHSQCNAMTKQLAVHYSSKALQRSQQLYSVHPSEGISCTSARKKGIEKGSGPHRPLPTQLLINAASAIAYAGACLHVSFTSAYRHCRYLLIDNSSHMAAVTPAGIHSPLATMQSAVALIQHVCLTCTCR